MIDRIAIYACDNAGRPVGKILAGPFRKSTEAWAELVRQHLANRDGAFCAVDLELNEVKWSSWRSPR